MRWRSPVEFSLCSDVKLVLLQMIEQQKLSQNSTRKILQARIRADRVGRTL
jgi:hypothetical protein